MDNCPSDLDIERFLEGKMHEGEASAVRKHLASCSECSAVYISALELFDAEDAELLTPISSAEKSRARDVLQAFAQSKETGEEAPESIWERPRRRPGLRERLSSVFSPFGVGAATLAGGSRAFMHMGVRNPMLGSSHKIEGDHTPVHESLTEIKSMNTNTAQTAWGLPPIDEYSPFVDQSYADTCAIRSQELILRDFGIDVSQEELINISTNKGWYVEGGGTQPSDVGNLLDLYGVETNRIENGNIFSLTSELAQGHRVIIGVDSGELWNPGWFEEMTDLFGGAPDHALIVAGLDTTDPEHMTVQLMDPGTGHIAKAYPLEQFMDAWADSNCMMVSTVEPAPPFAFGMENFDYASLHTPFVGEMPYAEFERFSTYLNSGDFQESLGLGVSGSDSNEAWDLIQGAWSEFQGDLQEGVDNVCEFAQENPELVDALTAFAALATAIIAGVTGEASGQEMLSRAFGDQVPDLGSMHLPEPLEMQFESFLADHGVDSSFVDSLTGGELGLADYYSEMADLFESLGDDASASWYQDQGADGLDDVGGMA